MRGISPSSPASEVMLAIPTRESPPITVPENPEDQQTAAIYQAVIRRLYKLHHASGEDLLQPHLFLLYSECETAAGQFPRGIDHKLFKESIRQSILHRLSDLPVWIIWLEQPDGTACDPDWGRMQRTGIAIAFHGIRCYDSDIAVVEGRIHRLALSVYGFEYVVEKRDGRWVVKSSYQKWLR